MQFDDTGPDKYERMVRVETKLDAIKKNMVTKADLSALECFDCRVEGVNNQTTWFVATAAVLAGIAFTAARLIH